MRLLGFLAALHSASSHSLREPISSCEMRIQPPASLYRNGEQLHTYSRTPLAGTYDFESRREGALAAAWQADEHHELGGTLGGCLALLGIDLTKPQYP